MPPKKARTSAGSSDVTTSSGTKESTSSARIDVTSPPKFVSIPEKNKRKEQDAVLSGEAASLEVADSPPPGRVTRSMTGSLPTKKTEVSPSAQTGDRVNTGRRQAQKGKRLRKIPATTTSRSPWDPTPRRRLNVEDLDLGKSYVGLIPLPAPPPQRPPRQPRWKHTGDKPLTDPKELPQGWNTREPDLSEDDIEGQIARCHERIADGIMPMIFENRLRQYLEIKEARDRLAEGEPEGLGWDVYRRLDSLKAIHAFLENDGDPFQLLSNCRAVIEAYRSGQLGWNPGLVTYWSNGKQLCQPRPFDWDEFEAINAKHNGHKDFWTEPVGGSELGLSLGSMTLAENSVRNFKYKTAFRIYKYDWWNELTFAWDTGASRMEMREDDLNNIAGFAAIPRIQQFQSSAAPLISTRAGIF